MQLIKEKVLISIKELKEQKVDYIFVSLHWGDEYIHRPSLKQIEDAHLFIDAGANYYWKSSTRHSAY